MVFIAVLRISGKNWMQNQKEDVMIKQVRRQLRNGRYKE